MNPESGEYPQKELLPVAYIPDDLFSVFPVVRGEKRLNFR